MDELNNKIILLRKSLKSIINQTKLNLIKKVKNDKAKNKNVEKKESELLCFHNNRIKSADVPLSLGLYPEKLEKILTCTNSMEIDRLHARILSNHIIQKNLIALKDKHGIESVEKFLKKNEKKVRQSSAKNEIKAVNSQKVEKTKDKKQSSSAEKIKNNTVNKKKVPKREENKSMDPFFTALDGGTYYASVTTIEEEANTDDLIQHRQPKKSFTKVPDRKRVLIAATKNPVQKSHVDIKQQHKESTNDDLHPSWKAKQQMKKSQILEFKGTKILFDE